MATRNPQKLYIWLDGKRFCKPCYRKDGTGVKISKDQAIGGRCPVCRPVARPELSTKPKPVYPQEPLRNVRVSIVSGGLPGSGKRS